MFFQSQIKNKKILAAVFGLLLLIGIFCFVQLETFDQPESISCTMEAKVCPDGTAVGRSGPNCEFTECSVEGEETPSGFGNGQIEKAITDYLVTQEYFGAKNRTDSQSFCAVENLDPNKELFPLYVWAYCGEYIVENGEVKMVSGSSGPAKIDYPNELSFYDLNKFSYEAPGDGENYPVDIKRIFPEDVQQVIFDFYQGDKLKNLQQKNEATARETMREQ